MTGNHITKAACTFAQLDRPLRVIVCSYESAYTSAFLSTLVASRHIEIVGLLKSTSLSKGTRSSFADDIQLLRRTGVFYVLYLWFATSSLLQKLRITRWNSMAQWAEVLGCALLSAKDVNRVSTQDALKDLAPDLIVSAHFNQIFSAEFIQNTRCALWNIHPSRLPDHRGLDPAFYVLLNGEPETGVTLHEISAKIDGGRILAQSVREVKTPVLHTLNLQLFSEGGTLLANYLSKQFRGIGVSFIENTGRNRYNSWPSSQQTGQFLKSGKRFVW